MSDKHRFMRLHWKLFFPIVGLLWLVIGITIIYFIVHERHRLSYNLENRLVNVNNTVIDAYESNADLQSTVDFIKLFTNQTTLDPLRLTVYDSNGKIIADNYEATILIHDGSGNILPEFKQMWNNRGTVYLNDVTLGGTRFMISSEPSPDGKIHTFAALPYNGEVLEFIGIDPMIWIVVIGLGILSFILAYLGSRAVCKNVYVLRDFADAISSNKLPENIESWNFSKDELGEVSKKLLLLYREKLRAEEEKFHHERQIGMNVSHELNTPVGIIKGYLDTILDNEDMPEEQKQRFLVRAKENTDRLVGLISDLNTVMRLQETGGSLECKLFNFYDIAVKLANEVNQGRVAGDMDFEFNVPKECYVKGHASLLTNALLNLIYNAAQHSGGTLITLNWLCEDNGQMLFSFSDNGTGVDEAHINRLFDLFYRVDNGRSRKNGGSGLGLSLVNRIFISMDGAIKVRNAAGGGLEFMFSLPAQ